MSFWRNTPATSFLLLAVLFFVFVWNSYSERVEPLSCDTETHLNVAPLDFTSAAVKPNASVENLVIRVSFYAVHFILAQKSQFSGVLLTPHQPHLSILRGSVPLFLSYGVFRI